MATAIWNNPSIAESNATVMEGGNGYLPPDSIRKDFFINPVLGGALIFLSGMVPRHIIYILNSINSSLHATIQDK